MPEPAALVQEIRAELSLKVGDQSESAIGPRLPLVGPLEVSRCNLTSERQAR
jgi:hypothetical protein